MTNELLRTPSPSFFVSISYHTFRVLSSVLDNFFGKIFRVFFIRQLCIILHSFIQSSGAAACHTSPWVVIGLGLCVILKSDSV